MAIPTLNELHKLQGSMLDLEKKAREAQRKAAELRRCGGCDGLLKWHRARTGHYDSRDWDGVTTLIEGGIAEFESAILEILAARQDLVAHEAMTQAVLKRAELGTFVALGEDTKPS